MSPRTRAVLAMLGAAALGLLSATQPWGSATLLDGRSLAVPGASAAGALTILSLACAALGLALTIAGRIGRMVLGALAVLLGAVVIAHALVSRAGVATALGGLVAEATGLSGSAQQAELASLDVSGWPAAALVGGAIAVAAGVWVLGTARRWPARGARAARFERADSGTSGGASADARRSGSGAGAPRLAWDALDDGDDPTR